MLAGCYGVEAGCRCIFNTNDAIHAGLNATYLNKAEWRETHQAVRRDGENVRCSVSCNRHDIAHGSHVVQDAAQLIGAILLQRDRMV
ncbi:hypothetical protein D3C80_1892520 [compost metagenome]